MKSRMITHAPKQSSAPLAGGLLQRKCDTCRKKKSTSTLSFAALSKGLDSRDGAAHCT